MATISRRFSTASKDPLVGADFRNWTVADHLASGSVADVYRIRRMERPGTADRALKVLKPEWQKNRSVTSRFREEANFLRELDHPDLIKVHHAGTIHARPCFSMTLGPPTDMHGIARRGPVCDLFAAWLRAIDAVAYLHKNNLTHNDCKPESFLLDPLHDRMLLIDFGTARRERSANASSGFLQAIKHRLSGARPIGSIAHTPPETLRSGLYHPGGDVYALGFCGYLLLSGQPPIRNGEPAAILEQVEGGGIRRLHGLLPSYLRPVADLIDHCLHPDPSKRPADAGELSEELEDSLLVDGRQMDTLAISQRLLAKRGL